MYQLDDKIRLERFREDCHKAIEKAKTSYLTRLGNKLNKKDTPQTVLEDNFQNNEQIQSS